MILQEEEHDDDDDDLDEELDDEADGLVSSAHRLFETRWDKVR